MDNHYFLIHLKFLAEVTGIAVLPVRHPLGIPSHSLPSDGSKHQTQTYDMGGCPVANIPVCRLESGQEIFLLGSSHLHHTYVVWNTTTKVFLQLNWHSLWF